MRQDKVRFESDEFVCEARNQCRVIGSSPAPVDPNVAALDPTELSKSIPERRHEGLTLAVPLRETHQYADPPHRNRLLRAHGERPRRSTAECQDELAPPHMPPLSRGSHPTTPF